jgi:16S rRNA processing protein RimM
MTDVPPEMIIVGRVREAHGIRGELVVEPITDEPGAVFASGRRVIAGTATDDPSKDRRELRILSSSPFQGASSSTLMGSAIERGEIWRDRFLSFRR